MKKKLILILLIIVFSGCSKPNEYRDEEMLFAYDDLSRIDGNIVSETVVDNMTLIITKREDGVVKKSAEGKHPKVKTS